MIPRTASSPAHAPAALPAAGPANPHPEMYR